MASDFLLLPEQELPVRVAITLIDHQMGLMFQKQAFPMIFPYRKARYCDFWMKNTSCPLDILFCYRDRVIAIERGEPFSTNLISSGAPCDLVVELPAGQASQLGLQIQSQLRVRYSLGTLGALFRQDLS